MTTDMIGPIMIDLMPGGVGLGRPLKPHLCAE